MARASQANTSAWKHKEISVFRQFVDLLFLNNIYWKNLSYHLHWSSWTITHSTILAIFGILLACVDICRLTYGLNRLINRLNRLMSRLNRLINCLNRSMIFYAFSIIMFMLNDYFYAYHSLINRKTIQNVFESLTRCLHAFLD